jgi:hypothetical protein
MVCASYSCISQMPPDVNSTGSSEGKDVGDEALPSLPSHVNTVKDGLLDFNHFLGTRGYDTSARRREIRRRR